MGLAAGFKKPYIAILLGGVTFASSYALYLGTHILRKDPHVIINKKENPHPWLETTQNTNLKLVSINRNWKDRSSEVKETFV